MQFYNFRLVLLLLLLLASACASESSEDSQPLQVVGSTLFPTEEEATPDLKDILIPVAVSTPQATTATPVPDVTPTQESPTPTPTPSTVTTQPPEEPSDEIEVMPATSSNNATPEATTATPVPDVTPTQVSATPSATPSTVTSQIPGRISSDSDLVISLEELNNLDPKPLPCAEAEYSKMYKEDVNSYCVPGCPPNLAGCGGEGLPIFLPFIPPVPPVISEVDAEAIALLDEGYYTTKSPYAGKTPGDVSGPVGPVGNTGVEPPVNGVLPGLDDRDVALWFDNRSNINGTYLNEHWTSRVDDKPYDLCDDAQLLRFSVYGRNLAPGEELTDNDLEVIEQTRQEYGVTCYNNNNKSWSKRYVAVGPSWYADKPTKAHVTPEHALEEILKRNPKGLFKARRLYPDDNTLLWRRIAGYHGQGREYETGRRFPLEPNDKVVLAEKATTITENVLRGLVHNQSQTLFARNVVVTASSIDEKENTISSSWSWPLTIQPGEFAPFEIENWQGNTDASKINFNITANMSPYLDITRSFSFRGGIFTYWNTVDIPIGLLQELYPEDLDPEDLVNGKVPDYWETGYERWTIDIGAYLGLPQSHPSLKNRISKLDLNKLDIKAFAMFWNSEIVPTGVPNEATVKMTLTDIVDLTPYLDGPYPAHLEYARFDGDILGQSHFGEFKIVLPLASPETNYHIWIGAANPAPPTNSPEMP